MSSLSRQQLVSWLRQFSIDDKLVLDVGAGPKDYHITNFVPGTPAVHHTLDINRDFNPTYALDINKDLNPDSTWVATPKTGYYDAIFAMETFEHLLDPMRALVNVFNWLREGGEFYFSAPFINPHHDTHDYLRITDEWWDHALTSLGMEVVEIEPRVAIPGAQFLKEFYAAEGLRMSKIRLKKGEAGKIIHIGYMGIAKKVSENSDD